MTDQTTSDSLIQIFFERGARKVLLLLLIFTIRQQNGFGVSAYSCLRCDDYNRLTKPDVSCAQTSADCGACKPGFTKDTDGDLLCFYLEILESGVDMIKNINEDVYLPCKFNSKISCRWTHDGKEVNIKETTGINWSEGNGLETHNCDINISHLSYEDLGKWVCSNKIDSTYIYVAESSLTISTNSKLTFKPEIDNEAEDRESYSASDAYYSKLIETVNVFKGLAVLLICSVIIFLICVGVLVYHFWKEKDDITPCFA